MSKWHVQSKAASFIVEATSSESARVAVESRLGSMLDDPVSIAELVGGTRCCDPKAVDLSEQEPVPLSSTAPEEVSAEEVSADHQAPQPITDE